MVLRPRVKKELSDLLKRITGPEISPADIESLFIKLRPYGRDYAKFTEIADFVAHHDQRDRGLTFDAIQKWSDRVAMDVTYGERGSNINVNAPFPIFLKRYWMAQAEACDRDVLKRAGIKLSPESLKHKIGKAFSPAPGHPGMCIAKEQSLGKEFYDALSFLSDLNHLPSSMTASELIDELVALTHKLQLDYDVHQFRSKSNEIILSIICSLHNVPFRIDATGTAKCRIAAERPLDHPEDHRRELFLYGSVTLPQIRDNLSVVFPVMSTGMLASEHCANDLYRDYQQAVKTGLEQAEFDFNCDVDLDHNFRLCRL